MQYPIRKTKIYELDGVKNKRRNAGRSHLSWTSVGVSPRNNRHVEDISEDLKSSKLSRIDKIEK